MPVALTYPGVYVEEVPSGVRTIAGVATSIGLFIGWATKGPIDKATRIFSFADFEREYGGLDHRSYLGYAVQHFFENGGSDAYVLRIAKMTAGDSDPPGTAAKTATAKIGDVSIEASSPGDWAHDYTVRLTTRPAPDAKRFKLEVLLGDPAKSVVVETYENLSLTDGDPRFVAGIVNARSRIIQVSVPATPADPASGVKLATLGGSSGTAGADGKVLDPNAVDGRQVVKALMAKDGVSDKLDLFNLVCVPGLTHAETIGTLQGDCARKRAFLIVDCPQDATVDSVDGDVANYIGSSPSHAAFYFPWVRASDPLQQGGIREFPPCGFVAGVMARTDAARGVWKAPAGTETALNGVVEFKETMSDSQNGALNPLAINCLRTLATYGDVVWGARTLDGDNNRGSEWKYVPVRRMALFLEESLFRGTQWVVFEPNDEPLWSQIRLNIGAFMQSLFRQGAFQGATPREAYFVKCDRTTTTQADINLGVVNIHVGFAPLKPAEFVVLHIQQIAGEIPA
jgi:Bacteriophage tail sheath protein